MPDPALVATITANGSVYSAWESVMLRRDYGNAISTFEFTPVEGSYGANYSSLKLQPGDNVTITLGGQLALTGVVTTRVVSYDDKSHQVVIAGKSKTADLKDSSVTIKPGNYNGYTFQQAAQAVMAPHGINLVMQNPPAIASKPFQTLSVQYGETCADFISRIAMMRGLFLSDDVNGNLVAEDAASGASTIASLVEGVNILRATATMDNQGVAGLYSEVSQLPGNDQNWPPRAYAATVTQSAGRPNIFRLSIAEHPGDAEDMAARVQHESMVAAWPVFKCSITTPGWLTPGGTLWDPKSAVSVTSPMLFPGASTMTLGIQAVVFAQDSQNGTTTTLELTLPQLLSQSATYGAQDVGNAPVSNPTPTQDAPDTPAGP